jgi:hypothetical protein
MLSLIRHHTSVAQNARMLGTVVDETLKPLFFSRKPAVFAPIPLPTGKDFHVVLVHAWRTDESGRNNHRRVEEINRGLQARNLITWIDSEHMKGSVKQEMTNALYKSVSVAICVTREYEKKVNSGNFADNCFYEFDVASNDEYLVNRRIPVALDKSMVDPRMWNRDRLRAELGGLMCVDASGDYSEKEDFERICDEIKDRVLTFMVLPENYRSNRSFSSASQDFCFRFAVSLSLLPFSIIINFFLFVNVLLRLVFNFFRKNN